MESRRIGTGRKLAVAVVSVALAFALLELVLRGIRFEYVPVDKPVVMWMPRNEADVEDAQRLHQSSPHTLWELRPGAPVSDAPGETINSDGYRGPALAREKSAGVLRVATLGDSSTFGVYVPYDETWSAQLVPALAERGVRAEVLNGGVIGYSIEQGLARYRKLVRPYRPDVVVAAFGAINDSVGVNGLTDLNDRDKMRRMADEKPKLSVLAQARTEWRSLQLFAWFADSTARAGGLAPDLHAVPTEFGDPKWPGVRRVSLSRFEDCVAELAREVHADGALLLLVSMPRSAGREKVNAVVLEYTKALQRAAGEHDLPLIDFRGRVQRELANGRTWEELFHDGFHPGPAGHVMFASEVAERIVAERAAPQPR